MGYTDNVNRVTGLSGIDTKSMIDKLMKAEGSKYDKLYQQNQLSLYTQTAYRGVASALGTFQTNNFTFGTASASATATDPILNYRSSSNFASNTTALTSTSGSTSGITVTSSANATGSSYAIVVKQMAQNDIYSGSIPNDGKITNTGTFDATKLDQGDSFSFTLDGQSKNITYTASDIAAIQANANPNQAAADITNAYLNTAFGTDSGVNKVSVDSNFNVSTTAGHSVQLSQSSTSVKTPTVMQKLMNGEGVDFNLNGSTTNMTFSQSDIATVNAATDRNQAAADLLNQKLQTSFGSYTDTSSNTVNVVSVDSNFNVTAEAGSSLQVNSTGTAENLQSRLFNGDKINVTVGGKIAAFQFSADEISTISAAPDQTVATHDLLQTKLAAAFGSSGTPSVPNVTIDSALNITATDGSSVTVDTTPAPSYSNLMTKAGFSATSESSQMSSNTSLADAFGVTSDVNFSINGVDFLFDKTDSLSTLMNKVNSSAAGATFTYNSISNSYNLSSKEAGTANQLNITDTTGLLTSGTGFGFTETKPAQDAVVNINGVDTTRSTNNVSLDGLSFTLNSADPTNTINIGISQDTSKTKSTIESFVNTYNSMLDAIYKESKTTRPKSDNYSHYDPLTKDQRTALSATDSAAWDVKAKTGLLYNDDILNAAESKLRQFVQQGVTLSDGTSLSLSQLGITTGNWQNGGKLQIDESKLDKSLATYGDKVGEMFTKSSSIPFKNTGQNTSRLADEGIGDRMNDILSMVAGNQGSIAQKAGIPSTTSATNNVIQTQITQQQSQLSDMLKALSDKENNYYTMFSKMETAVTNSNNQMSYLQSAFSTSGA